MESFATKFKKDKPATGSLADKARDPVRLITAKSPEGETVWFFIQTTKIKLEQFMRTKNGTLKIDDYGTVLARGWGDDPDEQTMARMVAEYGFEPKYQQE